MKTFLYNYFYSVSINDERYKKGILVPIWKDRHHTQETKDIISKCNTGRISKCRKPVKLIELDKIFSSYTDAWKWLVTQGLCKTKTSQSCNTQIKESIKRNTRAYGYHWEEV